MSVIRSRLPLEVLSFSGFEVRLGGGVLSARIEWLDHKSPRLCLH